MSYDLTFFPSKPGLDAHAAYREHQDREEREAADYKEWIKRLVPAAERAEMERIAGALQVRHPAFERFQPEQPLPFIELDDKDLQVQVKHPRGLDRRHMPYFRANARDMLHAVRICIEGPVGVIEHQGPRWSGGACPVCARRRQYQKKENSGGGQGGGLGAGHGFPFQP